MSRSSLSLRSLADRCSLGLLAAQFLIASAPAAFADSHCPEDMVAYWNLDEDGSVLAADSVGINDGMLYGNAAWTAGAVGSAVGFAPAGGNNGVVVAPLDDALDLTEDFAIEFWVLPNVWVQPRYVGLVTFSDGGRDQYFVGITPAGAIYFTYWDFGIGYQDLPGDTDWSEGEWHHVVVNVHTSANEVEFWRDGDLVATASQDFAARPIPSHPGAQLNIGRNPGENFEFDGAIDEVALYSRVLEPCEIRDHRFAGLAGHGPCEVEGAVMPVDARCPCEGPCGSDGWNNHGEYVSCVAHAVQELNRADALGEARPGDIVSAAARTDCGK